MKYMLFFLIMNFRSYPQQCAWVLFNRSVSEKSTFRCFECKQEYRSIAIWNHVCDSKLPPEIKAIKLCPRIIQTTNVEQKELVNILHIKQDNDHVTIIRTKVIKYDDSFGFSPCIIDTLNSREVRAIQGLLGFTHS